MSIETNKSLAERYFREIMSQGKTGLVDELFTADCELTITTRPDPMKGRDGVRFFVNAVREGFPDVEFTVAQQVAEGDKVLSRWNLKGTHTGSFLGIPPSGRAVTDHGHDVFHMKDGRIHRVWVNEDALGLMKQIGVIPEPPQKKNIAEENKLVLQRYFKEIMTGANMASVEELISPNFFFTIPTHAPARGPEGFKRVVNMLHTAFPDLTFTIEDMFAEGDLVAVRWTAVGTHRGPFLGIPASGKKFKIDGMGTYRVEFGQLVENLVNEDSLSLLQQIGAIPAGPA